MNCGAQIELSSERCFNCGTNLAELSPIEVKKKATTEIPKREDIDLSKIPSASPFKRILSGLIDCVIVIGLTLLVWAFIGKKITLSGIKLRWMILGLILPFLPALYFVLKDSLGGKSFGKMIVGLTTINLDKLRPANIADSLLRNALFAFIAIPILGWIAFFIIAISVGIQIIMGRSQRLGDGFAHTRVIDDRNLELLEKCLK